MEFAVGIDLGAESVTVVLINHNDELVHSWCLETKGKPVIVLRDILKDIIAKYPDDAISAVGVTGSGHKIAGAVAGVDFHQYSLDILEPFIRKNYPSVQVIMQVGQQDVAIDQLTDRGKRKGKKNDCIRGFGAFLTAQLNAWGISLSQWDALAEQNGQGSVRISAKCPLYMARDVSEKLQWGYDQSVIIRGINDAMVRCYLQNIAKDTAIEGDILLVGRLAQSQSFIKTLALASQQTVLVDEHGALLYAWAIAIQAQQKMALTPQPSAWRGRAILTDETVYDQDQCDGCENQCALLQLRINGQLRAVWGGRCDKWNDV